MANLAKKKGLHFKRYKSGNIRWYFGKDEYFYYQNLLIDYTSKGYDFFYKNPLLYTTLNRLMFRHFQSILAPESVKIEVNEAVALMQLLEKSNETGFLYHELKNLLAL